MQRRNKPEVLAPAGNLRGLKTAVDYGADAVYCGGKAFGMRSAPKNLSLEDFEEGSRYAHERGARVYVTCNVLPRNNEVEAMREYIGQLKDTGVDALIVSDIGVMLMAREVAPNLELHVSTQAGVTNYQAANAFYQLGARRVVLAREMDLQAVRDIRARIPDDLDIECFVHGAMCMAFSGRCLFSNYLTGRDGNHGECAQPCRWKYSIVEEKRPGQYFPIEQTKEGAYLFNSQDMNMLAHIDDLLDSGATSLKIEGRMKTALYVATVARTYRKAIDDYQKDPELYKKNMPWYLEQISNCTYRQFTTGFFFGKPDETTQIYDSNTYVKEYTYLGIIGEVRDGLCRIEQRNKFSVGEIIEIMKPNGENVEAKVERILNEEGEEQESAPHSKQVLYVALDQKADKYDILRRAEKDA